MKRVIVGAVLCLLLIGTGVLCLCSVCGRCSRVEALASQASEQLLFGQTQQAEELIDQLLAQWEQDEEVLRLFIRRAPLEEMERQLSGLQSLLTLGDYAQAAAALSVVANLAHDISQSELPLPQNIL